MVGRNRGRMGGGEKERKDGWWGEIEEGWVVGRNRRRMGGGEK